MKAISKGSLLFNICNGIIMLGIIVVTLAPFWFTIVGSLNDGIDYMRGGVNLWPREFTFANYKAVFSDDTIYEAYFVTAARAIIGTTVHVLFTALVAYGLSKTHLIGRNVYLIYIMITMFFSGGLIPTYLLYRDIGLLDNFLVYIIPNMFNVWDLIIIMSFMRTIPESILESARMDGAGEYKLFARFILPLSKPVLAAITLFNGVFHWNSYFDSMMFTMSSSLQTVQLFLMKMVTDASFAQGVGSVAAANVPREAMSISPETLKLAMMIAITLPIVVIYPFLQKYFVKGIMIGSVKG
ncbi:carbohydrate ABC transporter permease [Paenibacillus sp. J5C_2022]|uniref:carbohydrate ABC transporter permease n=1 Tax=Paenibacillus sp. J5C2022 TaxID=2977129 RepID=UPI0021D15A55|nr:carbohydrate ABC transporter permease [Paenibacillus sp. J5C2022]MCU6709036.1 carbohydrate ABC transporter permease [Paenibacillus sp. J5C2022]